MQNIHGEIIIVDNEQYESDFYDEILKQLSYEIELIQFASGEDCLKHLKTTDKDVFLIISEINLKDMSGYEFKDAIDSDKELKNNTVPFIFATTNVTPEIIQVAYTHNIQGLFEKPTKLSELFFILSSIIKYWLIILSPEKMKYIENKQTKPRI